MLKTFLTLLISLALTSSAFAQAALKDQIYVIDDFSGGLNTKSSPFSLGKNEGDVAENVRYDSELNAFTKRDNTVLYGTANASNPILGMHRLYLTGGTKVLLVNYSNKIAKGNDNTGTFTDILTLTSGDRRMSWLTWHNNAIGTDGYNSIIKYDGSSASATYVGSLLATESTAGNPNGTYTYKVTCYTSGYEASMNVASNSVTVSSKKINLSMIPICPDTFLGEDVVGRKVYRPVTGGSTYKLLSNGTIADNTTLTLTDNDSDASLGANLNATNTLVIPKGKLGVIHKNRLWIANDPDNPSRIYYSEDASLDFFLPDSYFDIRKEDGDEITFVKNVLGKLTVGKNNSIQKIYTDGDVPEEDWEISDPFSFIGCQALYTAVNTSLGVLYLGNNGIYVFNGQYSKLLSDKVTPEILDISPSNFPNAWAEYYKNSYYLAYTSRASGGSTNNRVLVLDLLTDAFSIDLLNINVFHVFKSGNDVEALYSGGSSTGKVFAHTENITELINNTASDFLGTFDDMRVIPEDGGGDPTSPILELAWTETIDQMIGTIDSITGIIDRPDTDGSYISQFFQVSADTLDKLYWNESIPGAGDITFSIRTGLTTPDTAAASWVTEQTVSSGSDISQFQANVFLQYRILMTTDSIVYTPTVIKANNYNVRITYNRIGEAGESTIPIQWRTGWLDLGYPGRKKVLRKVYAYYEYGGVEGTLNLDFESYDGQEDNIDIDMETYPTEYVNYFTNGALLGELFRITIAESSDETFKFKRLQVVFDVEPLI